MQTHLLSCLLLTSDVCLDADSLTELLVEADSDVCLEGRFAY